MMAMRCFRSKNLGIGSCLFAIDQLGTLHIASGIRFRDTSEVYRAAVSTCPVQRSTSSGIRDTFAPLNPE
eukprot:2533469-Pleurochrysis_carterae.AAC.1